MPRIELVVFDMAGTTVEDRIDGVPLVLKSYDDAFRNHGVLVPYSVLNEQRGRDKWTVIEEFGGANAPEIYEDFLGILRDNIGRVREIDGASEAFGFLRRRGIKVAVGTGFPSEVAQGIVERLSWLDSELIDLWVCSEMVGASRPDPAMILEAMRRLGVREAGSVMKVDDTVKGIEEGLRAGAVAIGVLTGTQDERMLRAAGPADVIGSVRELPDYMLEKGYV